MNYISIDIETTGLDPVQDQILEFCAIADDWQTPLGELPYFERVVKRDRIRGNPFAMHLNSELLKKISLSKIGVFADGHKTQGCVDEDQLLYQFRDWVVSLGMIPTQLKVAGHNAAGFDVQFIKRLSGYGESVQFHHRVLDVGSLYFKPGDHELPATQKCLTRAGIPCADLPHRAFPDAMNAVKLIRLHYGFPIA